VIDIEFFVVYFTTQAASRTM